MQIRGVTDRKFFLFRLTQIFADQSQNLGRNTNEIVNLWDAKRN